MKYIVIKTLVDGTFTTQFFSTLERAQRCAEEYRRLSKMIVESVQIYELTSY